MKLLDLCLAIIACNLSMIVIIVGGAFHPNTLAGAVTRFIVTF